MSATDLKPLLDLGFSAVLCVMLYIVYTDGKADRLRMLDSIAKQLDEFERLKNRIILIEYKLGIDDPPTLPKRPDQPAP